VGLTRAPAQFMTGTSSQTDTDEIRAVFSAPLAAGQYRLTITGGPSSGATVLAKRRRHDAGWRFRRNPRQRLRAFVHCGMTRARRSGIPVQDGPRPRLATLANPRANTSVAAGLILLGDGPDEATARGCGILRNGRRRSGAAPPPQPLLFPFRYNPTFAQHLEPAGERPALARHLRTTSLLARLSPDPTAPARRLCDLQNRGVRREPG
jgi:hypothetical protein